MAETNIKKQAINIAWCKGCGICVAFCPTHALSMTAVEKASLTHPESCTSCGMCELRCPDLAIELE
jgi:2-oxoglutarate ferredoxin oxidoreductase subunit delta